MVVREGARGGRLAKRVNAESRRIDGYYGDNVLHDPTEVRERVQSEALPCSNCGELVHPDNLAHHMDLYHAGAALSVQECDDLGKYEAIIERGLQTFYEVGNTLLAIREGRLYRQEHKTFEAYCERRWNVKRNYANKLISAAEVVGNLGTTVPILPTTERQIRPLTSLPTEEQAAAWQEAVETAPNGKITAAHVQSVVDARQGKTSESRPLYSSNSHEWYTPADLVERIRTSLGGSIDLDPCSSPDANETVRAQRYYTAQDNGIAMAWNAETLFMNPPYGGEIEDWVTRLVEAHTTGEITRAVALVPARTDTAWFRLLREYPRCFLFGRIKFQSPTGVENSAPFPSMAVYLGSDFETFARAFADIGDIYVRLA